MSERPASSSRVARSAALAVAALGLALTAYVEFAKTTGDAGVERFGWFVYEAAAWLALLALGGFAPIGVATVVAALAALGLEAFAYWSVFVEARVEDATLYLWKPLAQLAIVAGAAFGGYLAYLRRQREAARA